MARTVAAYAWAVRVRSRVRGAHAGGRAGLRTDVGSGHSHRWFGGGGFHGPRRVRSVAHSAGDLSACDYRSEIANTPVSCSSGTLPRPAVDLLRRFEHRLSATARAHQRRPQLIDLGEIEVIADWLARRAARQRILVADDAVDSGVTLGTVLRHLRAVCPSGTEIRTAAITQTLEKPMARPDYALFHGTLCRFPWSFDAVR